MSGEQPKVGDSVRVKGIEHPTMTVTSVRQDGTRAWVTWFQDGDWKEATFHPNVLTVVASN